MGVDTKVSATSRQELTPPSAKTPPEEVDHGKQGDATLKTRATPLDNSNPTNENPGGAKSIKMDLRASQSKTAEPKGGKVKSDIQKPNKKSRNIDINSKNDNFKDSKNKTSFSAITNHVSGRNKSNESVKNGKVGKISESDGSKVKASRTNFKEALVEIERGKYVEDEDDLASNESSTEYVTFDEYLDKIAEGKPHERKLCYNKLEIPDRTSARERIKPLSSSSSSFSSVSTINDSPSTSSKTQNIAFDAKSFRTSLLEASEIPPHEVILLQCLNSRCKQPMSSWTPLDSSSSTNNVSLSENKTTSNGSKSISKQQTSFINTPKFSRAVTVAAPYKDENASGSGSGGGVGSGGVGGGGNASTISVYDRLMSLGRYQEFVFQHRPDDLGWYMKQYRAAHTVARAGSHKKKKGLRFGLDVPDPYVTLGKKVPTSSNLLLRQSTSITQGDKVSASTKRDSSQSGDQPIKQKNGQDNPDQTTTNDEKCNKRDRNYPLLAQTRDVNAENGKPNKSSKSDKTVKKSTSKTGDHSQDKRQKTKQNSHNNAPSKQSSQKQSQQLQNGKLHPTLLPPLSGEDVRQNLISSKIVHKHEEVIDSNIDNNINRNYNNDNNNNDNNGDNNGIINIIPDDNKSCCSFNSRDEASDDGSSYSNNCAKERLWANPFPTLDDSVMDCPQPNVTDDEFHKKGIIITQECPGGPKHKGLTKGQRSTGKRDKDKQKVISDSSKGNNSPIASHQSLSKGNNRGINKTSSSKRCNSQKSHNFDSATNNYTTTKSRVLSSQEVWESKTSSQASNYDPESINKSSVLCKEQQPQQQQQQQQHLKAELEKESDGTLMVKISVFDREKTLIADSTVNICHERTTRLNDRHPSLEDNGIHIHQESKSVDIHREDTSLIGKELHTKLLNLNNNNNRVSDTKKELHNKTKDVKKYLKKEGNVTFLTEIAPECRDMRTTNWLLGESNQESFIELHGIECKKKSKKSAMNDDNKCDEDRYIYQDGSLDQYPRHRSAYQDIDLVGHKSKIARSKPTIKYTKTKEEIMNESGKIHGNIKQNKHASGYSKHKQQQQPGHVRLTHTVVSGFHLSLAGNLDGDNSKEGVMGKSLHQNYPLNEWKKTVDMGHCGFIVKSFPAENVNGLGTNVNNSKSKDVKKSNYTDDVEHDNDFFVDKSSDNGKGISSLKTKSLDEKALSEMNIPYVYYNKHEVGDDNLQNCGHGDKIDNNIATVSLEVKPIHSQSNIINKSRPLFRPSRQPPPLIKISRDTEDMNIHIDDSSDTCFTDIDNGTNSCNTYHFPPLWNPETHTEKDKDKDKTLDDLFVTGISRDRSRSRDIRRVSKKRPVSLDRGLIDDIVRHHTESSAVGFKHQNTLSQSQSFLPLNPTHPHPHHPPNGINIHNQSLRSQPEESPSLTPSIQRLDKIYSNLRPRPAIHGDTKRVKTELDTKEFDHKRPMQIYAHLKRVATPCNDKTVTKTTELRHVLRFN